MKKLILALLLVLLSVSLAWAQPGPRPGILIKDADDASYNYAVQVIVPANSLSFTAPVATLTLVADPDANGTVDLDEVGNPGANKTFTMANYTLKFDYTTDDPSTITFIEYEFDCLATDTDVVFFWLQADANGTPVDLMKITGTATRATVTGDATYNFSSYNLSSIDALKINNTNFDEVDPTWETGISGTTLTMTGAIVGELSEIDEGAISGDTLTAAQCRGTLITNEGDADGETWELPTAESGLHFKAICAETQDMVFDAGASDKIYVSDDDSIAATGDDGNVTMDCANVGESMTCVTFSQDGSTWDWLCECGAGSCTGA